MSAPQRGAWSDVLFPIVASAVAIVLGCDPADLRPDTLVADELGADSLAIIEVVEVTEERLRGHGIAVRVDDDVLARMRTLADLVDGIRDQLGSGAAAALGLAS